MSYDISFRVKVEGVDAYADVGDCGANITWNAREIIQASTGLPWLNEQNNGLCTEVIPKIVKGYNELYFHTGEYWHYESTSGWGTVESTRQFFKQIMDDWEHFEKWHEELVPVATFWIM